MGEKGCSCKRGRLAGGNATHERKECVERTCEGVIVLTQSDEGKDLRVIDCLFCMSCWSHAGGYVFDSTGVNQLRLSGPVLEIEGLLPALTRVGF